jgi:hypothetical protein
MNARGWFCIGLSLMGVYFLVTNCSTAISNAVFFLLGSRASGGAILYRLVELVAGLVLVIASPALASALARRLERTERLRGTPMLSPTAKGRRPLDR